MIEWHQLVIGGSILLLLLLIWKETRRKHKSRLLGRLIATVVATSSLACIALPLTFTRLTTTTKNNAAILLTDGFSHDSVKKFSALMNMDMPVVTTVEGLPGAEEYDALYIPDAGFFLQQHPEIKTMHVFGYGLQENELQALKNTSVVYHPSRLPTGITAVHWSTKIKSGERLLIQGSYNNVTAPVTIILKAYGVGLDTAILYPGRRAHFELATIPKHAGRILYTITVATGNDIMQEEPVPVQVGQGEPVSILMLASSPDFENKFLKNWLSKNGYAVTTRTAISKNKFLKEFLNMSEAPVDRVTPALLSKFDVVIADAAQFNSVSPSESAAIQAQVAGKGMGLIIRADTVDKSSFYSRLFPLTQASRESQQEFRLILPDSSTTPTGGGDEPPVIIRNTGGSRSLVEDKQQHSFASVTTVGTGKILVTTVSGTSAWALSGAEEDYARFWTTLLNNATTNTPASESWMVTPFIARVDNPVQLHLQSNTRGMPQAQIGETTVSLKANPGLPFEWTGTYYPNKAGWQSGIQLDGEVYYWYAYSKNDWKLVRAAESVEATKKYSTENIQVVRNGVKEEQPVEHELPKFLFVLVFLLSAAYLWLENKM